MLNIHMKGRAVLHSIDMSPEEISGMRRKGEIGPLPASGTECAFMYGEQPIARGTIVKKKGRYYFRVRTVDV